MPDEGPNDPGLPSCPKCRGAVDGSSSFCPHCGTSLRLDAETLPCPAENLVAAPEAIRPAVPPVEGGVFAGKFRILDLLGRGGMGIVYLAEDVKLRRRIALKLLPPHLVRDAETRKRFLREAQAAAALDHPNICTVHEAGESDGQPYLAMALVDGQTLEQRIAGGPLPLGEALDVALQVAEALRAAHEQGIIHRDVKPANIMLTKNGPTKVMDFGLARFESGSDLTQACTVMGTAAYMSPEQAQGEQVDRRADLWALGCTLFAMLSGRSPFHREQAHAALYAIVHEDPPQLSALRPGLPADLDRILDTCLRKDPSRRYPDAGALIADLEGVKRREAAASPTSAERSLPSLAVLPFVDMSPLKDHDYFAEGLAEELINALAQLKGLHVVARTSAFAFRGQNKDVREIGSVLNVRAVVEGSVRVSGSRLRITAQLINVDDGYHLWSERFDREMADVFAIQEEISAAIVEKLKVNLLAWERTALGKRSTEDPEAYRLYLRGLHFVNRADAESIAKALDLFREAVEKDPGFALAHTGTAYAFMSLANMNFGQPAEMWAKAKVSVEKALALDDDRAEAHFLAAARAYWYDWDWDAAERSFGRALALNPGRAYTRGNYAFLCMSRGRFDESAREIRAAQDLDPVMPLFYAWGTGLLAAMGRPDDALEDFARALEIAPDFGLAYFHAGVAYIQKGLLDQAIETFEKSRELGVAADWVEGLIGMCHEAKGDRATALRSFENVRQMIERKDRGPLSFATIGLLAGRLGLLDEAFAFLDRAYAERDPIMPFIHLYAGFLVPSLHSDPRFRGLLLRMKAPGYSTAG
jgi:serine/threonine protein kinase/Tfp pilus assembly protein PilF